MGSDGPSLVIENAFTMPRFVLHIGLEKTGTSSIQAFLSANRRVLFEHHRLLYPVHSTLFQGDSHIKIPASLMPPSQCEFLAPETIPESSRVRAALHSAAKSDADVVVLSAEHFSSRLDRGAIERFSDWLRPHEVEILVYLRRQDEMALSAFSTELRCGRRAWFDPHDIRPADPYYNYQCLLESWTTVFGAERIRIRVFDPRQLKNGDLIQDFVDALGIEEPSTWVRTEPRNSSINLAEARLLHLINSRLPTWPESVSRGRPEDYRRAQEVRARVLSEASNLPAFQQSQALSSILAPQDRQSIIDRFHESNREVALTYLGAEQLFRASSMDVSATDLGMHRTEAPPTDAQMADLVSAMALRIHDVASMPITSQLARKAKRFALGRLNPATPNQA